MSQEKAATIFSALRKLEEVDEALLARPEVGYLASVLEDSELPEFIASGSFSNGCFVATDRRVIHIEKAVFSSSFKVKSFPYAEILSVKIDFLRNVELTLHTGKTKPIPIEKKRDHAAVQYVSAKVRSGEIFPDIPSQVAIDEAETRRRPAFTRSLSWIFGSMCTLAGLAGLLDGADDVVTSVAFLAIGALLLPPIRDFAHGRTGYALPRWARTFSILGLLVVAGAFVPPQAEENSSAQSEPVSRQQESAATAENQAETAVAEERGIASARQAEEAEEEARNALRTRVERALGSSNRNVLRVTDARLQGARIYVRWAINDNLTEGLIQAGAQRDIRNILEALADSAEPYTSVFLRGTFPLVDQFGNESETNVVEVLYTKGTIERINFENFLRDNVYAIAENADIHPAFR